MSTETVAIQSPLGGRVSNECFMCGVKRVMINGLKGGETPVLVDDILIQPLLSGFNGLDSAAMVGVVAVEIALGESA